MIARRSRVAVTSHQIVEHSDARRKRPRPTTRAVSPPRAGSREPAARNGASRASPRPRIGRGLLFHPFVDGNQRPLPDDVALDGLHQLRAVEPGLQRQLRIERIDRERVVMRLARRRRRAAIAGAAEARQSLNGAGDLGGRRQRRLHRQVSRQPLGRARNLVDHPVDEPAWHRHVRVVAHQRELLGGGGRAAPGQRRREVFPVGRMVRGNGLVGLERGTLDLMAAGVWPPPALSATTATPIQS